MLLAAYEDQSRNCIPRASNPALAQSRSRSRPHRRGGLINRFFELKPARRKIKAKEG